ncbi:MAG: hypothetical protein WBR26_10010 [Candidatus Acidiferrum sp.]
MSENFATPMTLPFDLAKAVEHLCGCDEQLKRLVAETRAFQIDLKNTHSPYEVLLRSICYQSISGKAASTIFGRIKALGENGRPPTPAKMLKMPVAKLRKAGLSAAKAASMKDLAKKALAGIVPTYEEALKLSDEELVERLISVRGIGAWTVEMFLIFRLGRPDVLPIHDLGVKKGWSVTYGKKHMPTPKELLKFGERWRPIEPSRAGICGGRSKRPDTRSPTRSVHANHANVKRSRRARLPRRAVGLRGEARDT